MKTITTYCGLQEQEMIFRLKYKVQQTSHINTNSNHKC